ncbi:sulfite exporter TauE/SafE family protein [candidate division KSB1 bacterium]
MDWYLILAVIGAGFLCGFINTLAGSGSVISLPMLIFLGLPANVANGTNRIAILLQSLTGVAVFRQHKMLEIRKGLVPSLAAVIGSLIGANIAIEIDDAMMEKLIGVVMIIMLVVVIYKPKKWLEGKQETISKKTSVIQFIVFFFIGIYGGLIQAGVGIFLLSALVLSVGLDLVRANAIKLLIVTLYTPFALAVFMIHDQVNYKWGFILAIGNVMGAYVASKFAVNWGPQFIRYVLIVVMIYSALELFGIINIFPDH